MPIAAAEVLVVDWQGHAADLSPRLARLLALGIDVVVVPSAASAAAVAATRVPPDGPGRLVHWSGGDGDPVAWARHRLVGRGAPAGSVAVARDAADLDAHLDAAAGFPAPVADATWRVDVDGADPERERQVESWLTVGNGRTGTRGSLEEGGPTSLPALYVAGVFGQDPAEQAGAELVPGVQWASLQPAPDGPPAAVSRTLDLRQGVLFRDGQGSATARFASLADRRLLVLEADPAGWRSGPVPVPAVGGTIEAVDTEGDRIRLRGRAGGAVSFVVSTTDDGDRIRRVVTVDREGEVSTPASAQPVDVEALTVGQRRAWRERWLDADVVVDGDDDAQQELRFALYHLIAAGDPESDAASIGARALTGPGYRGHVFWDTEIFVLPFFAWTHPQTARALLAYRYRTLPAARHKAARLGYEGALYAWESTDTGEETTPDFVFLPDGHRLTILTGVQEHHIAADVAWAVMHYVQVSGDDAFLEAMGAEIVVETARFWASRARRGDDGTFHVCEVIGPDEYHEGVDDNAYTNVLARWNLRAAATVCDGLPAVAERLGVTAEERDRWRTVAGGLVDNFDPSTRLYEQFEGFYALDPVRAVDLAPRPFTGEMVLGVDRLRTTQVVKQADVVLLGVLLPDEVGPDVLAANYRHYEPLTSHGSSLSPAMHALVAARIGALDDALGYFALAGGVDLHNRMGNAADGVHIATMGGLWQAAVFGFGGVRADGDAVRVDPRLPDGWAGLAFSLRWRGSRLAVDVRGDGLDLDLDAPATVALGSGRPERLEAGHHVGARDGSGWSWTGPA
ncbi:MAG TPA: glycosyl hydrolase family 65 protein [Acidimicrobiales bacterium]|nr:glycosyl hydrolase family 65 protein [Acidimicrobiales bacterium]